MIPNKRHPSLQNYNDIPVIFLKSEQISTFEFVDKRYITGATPLKNLPNIYGSYH